MFCSKLNKPTWHLSRIQCTILWYIHRFRCNFCKSVKVKANLKTFRMQPRMGCSTRDKKTVRVFLERRRARTVSFSGQNITSASKKNKLTPSLCELRADRCGHACRDSSSHAVILIGSVDEGGGSGISLMSLICSAWGILQHANKELNTRGNKSLIL